MARNRRPSAVLYSNGSALYQGDDGTPLFDLMGQGWRGIHAFLEQFPTAKVELRGDKLEKPGQLSGVLDQIALPPED